MRSRISTPGWNTRRVTSRASWPCRSKARSSCSGARQTAATSIWRGRGAVGGAELRKAPPRLSRGWAERVGGNAVLSKGRPIQVVVPADAGDVPAEPGFLTELSFGDPVRVTGALVFDNRHG